MIRWLNDTFGEADLDAVRKLYRNQEKCQQVEGDTDPEPRVGDIHRLGTDREPVVISRIDYRQRKVIFAHLPKPLAQSIISGSATMTPGRIVVPKGAQ